MLFSISAIQFSLSSSHATNISRMPNCPNITIKLLFGSGCLFVLFSCCLAVFCPDITLIKCLKPQSHSLCLKFKTLSDSERVGIELPGQLRLVTLFVGINYHYIYSIINKNQLSLQKIFRSLCWVGFLIISTISWCFLTGRFVASFAFHQTVILRLLWCFLLGFQKPVRNQYVTRCVLSEPSV